MPAATPLLAVDHLSVNFGPARVVDEVSFRIAAGEKFGLVGESGSGKSVTALSILKLVPDAAYAGEIRLEGADVLAQGERAMRGIRGNEVAMIFQEPMTALNPLRTIGDQIAEMFSIHTDLSKAEIGAKVLALLADVRIPDPKLAAKAS